MKKGTGSVFSSKTGGFAQRAGILSVNAVLKFALQFFIIIVFAEKLSLAQYGIYQSVWLFVNTFSVIGLFGLYALILSSPLNDVLFWIRLNRKRIFLISIILNLLCAAYIFAVGSFSFYEKIFLLILSIVQNFSFIQEALLIKKEKEKKLFATNFFYLLLYGAVHLRMLYGHYSLSQLLGSLVIITVLKCILLAFQCRGILTDHVKKEITDPSAIRSQWLYLGFLEILNVLVKWLDKWVILLLLPVAQFAVYFNGSYEIPVFGLLATAAGSIMLSELSEKKQNDAEAAKAVMTKGSVFLASFIFPASCFLFFYNANFFHAVFGSKYDASIPVFRISILVLPVRAVYSTGILQSFNRARVIVTGAILDLLLTIIFALILYPVMKMPGLALSFVLSSYVQVFFYLRQTGKMLMKPFWDIFPLRKMLFMFLISLAITGFFKYAFNSRADIPQIIYGILSGGMLCLFFLRGFIFGKIKI